MLCGACRAWGQLKTTMTCNSKGENLSRVLVQSCVGPGVCWLSQCASPTLSACPSLLRLGTQFTSEHYLLEGAREVVAAGGDSFKFNLANLDARGNAISVGCLLAACSICNVRRRGRKDVKRQAVLGVGS